jgi:hypothetical protein
MLRVTAHQVFTLLVAVVVLVLLVVTETQTVLVAQVVQVVHPQ